MPFSVRSAAVCRRILAIQLVGAWEDEREGFARQGRKSIHQAFNGFRIPSS